MRKQNWVIISLLVVSLVIPVMADDEVSYDQVFNYFPDTTYQKFGFFNLEAAKETPVYGIFRKLGSQAGDLLVSELPPLPESMLDEAQYIVSGKFDDAKSREFSLKLGKRAEKLRDSLGEDGKPTKEFERDMEQIAEQSQKLNRLGSIWNVYIPGVQEHVAQGVKDGYFVRTGEKFMSLPIYNVQVRGKSKVRGQASEAFAYVTTDGDLLVSLDKESIRAMLECANGTTRSLVDNQDYLAALGKVDRTHQGWSIEPKKASTLRMIEFMLQEGKPQEDIDKLENDISHGAITEIQSVFLDEEVIIRKKTEYTTEKEAEEEEKKMAGTFKSVKGEMKNARKEFNKQDMDLKPEERRMARTAMGFAGNLLNNNKITREGTVLITDILFSKKQLNTLGMLLSFAEAMEEKEAAKEEQQNQQ